MPTTTIKQTPFLRTALLGDAAASGATGLLLVIAAGPLAPLLGLPEPLLLIRQRGIGADRLNAIVVDADRRRRHGTDPALEPHPLAL